jgi:hypothetical protein
VTAPLPWLGVILLAWTAVCALLWALYLQARRRERNEAAAARRQARDEAAGAAAERLTDVVDEEYRALCEKEGGRG